MQNDRDKNNNNVNRRFIDWWGTHVYTNICNSCVNRVIILHKLPECRVFGKIPHEYITAEKSDCPYYKLKPDARPQDMPYTHEDEKMGKPRPVIPKEKTMERIRNSGKKEEE